MNLSLEGHTELKRHRRCIQLWGREGRTFLTRKTWSLNSDQLPKDAVPQAATGHVRLPGTRDGAGPNGMRCKYKKRTRF